MNIRKIVGAVLGFFLNNRKSGTSTLINKIAAENDVWVLIPKLTINHTLQPLGKKMLTFDDLLKPKIMGHAPKPILVDNYTMLELCKHVYDEFKSLDAKIDRHNNLLRDVKHVIEEFEREEKKYL